MTIGGGGGGTAAAGGVGALPGGGIGGNICVPVWIVTQDDRSKNMNVVNTLDS